jgi:hypothetical protein
LESRQRAVGERDEDIMVLRTWMERWFVGSSSSSMSGCLLLLLLLVVREEGGQWPVGRSVPLERESRCRESERESRCREREPLQR